VNVAPKRRAWLAETVANTRPFTVETVDDITDGRRFDIELSR
jgi:hypothetical protein